MLKRFFFTTLITLFFTNSFCQTLSSQKKEDLNIKKFSKTSFSFNAPWDSISIAVHSISVVDARPDSSAFGLYQLSSLTPRFIVTPKGFRTESEQFINKYARGSKSDSFSVLMVVKKFWLSTGVQKADNDKMWNFDYDTAKKMNLSLSAKIEFYLSMDSGYFALYRFDSVFSIETDQAPEIYDNLHVKVIRHLVQHALETSMSKLATMDSGWSSLVSSKRRFTWNDIKAHDSKTLDFPALKDSLPVPGVYLTFEEFKNNSPSIREFEITKDKLNDLIYVKQTDGRQIPFTKAWGYCDSSFDTYVRLYHNYFKLQRRQNAFYVYGSTQAVHETHFRMNSPTVGPNGTMAGGGGGYETESEKYILWLKPFQLDWDSGELH